MKTKIGVFITTHVSEGSYRHGFGFHNKVLKRMKDIVIPNYKKYNAGKNIDLDLYIMDTESTSPEFLKWVNEVNKKSIIYPNINIIYKKIPNKSGVFASMNYNMFGDNLIEKNGYDFVLFHTDDSVYIQGDNWATKLLHEFRNKLPIASGIMCRAKETIRLGSEGLVDHRNICSHIAKIYGIDEVKSIGHLHADWYLLDKRSFKLLQENWYSYDPEIKDAKKYMEYQIKLETTNYIELANKGDGRKSLDNMHIGKETAMYLICGLAGIMSCGYDSDNIICKRC